MTGEDMLAMHEQKKKDYKVEKIIIIFTIHPDQEH